MYSFLKWLKWLKRALRKRQNNRFAQKEEMRETLSCAKMSDVHMLSDILGNFESACERSMRAFWDLKTFRKLPATSRAVYRVLRLLDEVTGSFPGV